MDEENVKQVPESPKNDNRDRKNIKTEIYDWFQCFVVAVLAIVLLFTFVLRLVGVVGESMNPTLDTGDRVVISNLFYTPKQGDIVVLKKDTFKDELLIKRIIAVENQEVDIDFENGIVYVDGEPLQEEYILEPTYTQEDFNGPITVPEGCVFVMGDNRNNSTDSRDARIGCVETGYIVGRVLLRVMPFDSFGFVD
jgi:signal peptidase I